MGELKQMEMLINMKISPGAKYGILITEKSILAASKSSKWTALLWLERSSSGIKLF